MADELPLLTFGHGRLDGEAIGALLLGAGVQRVVDVRRFPGSRANPAAGREAFPALMDEFGIDYRWDERLGGRRALPAGEVADSWWEVKAFQAYAAWTRSAEFRAALPELLADLGEEQTAVMCSESVWWRCHRRLIADVIAIEDDVVVEHLMHDGRLSAHRPSAGARLGPGGRLVWDG